MEYQLKERMEIKISKSDIIWSYIAQFFNIGAGIITLPLILHSLSTEEIALNYLMLTIGTIVALLDFGFAPQFGRNFAYVFSGARKIQKEGLNEGVRDDVDYHLLRCLIDVAKRVYGLIGLLALILMLTIGTWYIYYVTDGFNLVNNSFLIWIFFSVTTFFNIYLYYFSSLLTGRGLIKESKKTLLASKLTYIGFSYLLILCGVGLIGVCVANLLSSCINLMLSYHFFYDKGISLKLSAESSSSKERKELFSVIWYNAKKLGINFVGAYAILKFGMFLAGLYLTMKEISSYGLMLQLGGVIAGISTTFMTAYIPNLSSLKVNSNKDMLIRTFAWSMNIYYILFILGSFLLILFGPFALRIIGSHAELPSQNIVLMFLIVTLLENNHSLFATFITIGNEVPFVKAALLSGVIICIGDLIVLQFTSLGIWGLVVVQGIVQLAFNNWYWPRWVLNDLNISFISFIAIGLRTTVNKIKMFTKF